MNSNINSQLGSSSISNTDLIDAKLEEHQLCGSKHCPGCGHKLDGKPDWVGLPAGVKFDPTDQELLEHLEAKVEARVEARELKSHPLIDEFILTIDGEDGICYTHPEKLPGVARDGSNRHFFHRPSKAYTTGTRKRRKIQTECDLQSGETRWHKTGKTRPVLANGMHKGCKKILVLYTNFGKNRKPEKTNWVMHQYHLGQQEEEKEGELVVSKIFYQTQPRQCTSWTDRINNSSALVIGGNEGGNISSEPNSRRDSGSGSCSSKEITTLRDEVLSSIVGVSPITNYHPVEMPQFRVQNDYNFVPFGRNFDDHQLGIIGGEASTAKGSTSTQATTTGACQENDMMQVQQHQITAQQQQQQQQLATAANFHMNTPSHSISSILPAPLPLHHTTTTILLNEDPFHVSRMMLQNENLQQHHQQQQQQHDHKLGESSTSGLEELIMACTSTDIDIKEESSIPNPQEADWLKYSTFWSDPHDHNNPDHHV